MLHIDGFSGFLSRLSRTTRVYGGAVCQIVMRGNENDFAVANLNTDVLNQKQNYVR